MSYPTSHMAYLDCFEVMDRALADGQGVRLRMADRTAAEYQRTRINYARKLNRKQNEKIYPDPEHPLHGASPYDKLVCRIKSYNGSCYLYVEQYAPIYKEIEDLSELDDEIQAAEHEFRPVRPPVHDAPAPASDPKYLEEISGIRTDPTPRPTISDVVKSLIKRRV